MVGSANAQEALLASSVIRAKEYACYLAYAKTYLYAMYICSKCHDLIWQSAANTQKPCKSPRLTPSMADYMCGTAAVGCTHSRRS